MNLFHQIVMAISAFTVSVSPVATWQQTPEGHPYNCIHDDTVGYDQPYRQYSNTTGNWVQVPYAAATQMYNCSVTGSTVASPPNWTTPFGTLVITTYSYLAESGYGYNMEGSLAPHTRRDYFATAAWEYGDETWQLVEGETVQQTEHRHRDWYSNGAVAWRDARI